MVLKRDNLILYNMSKKLHLLLIAATLLTACGHTPTAQEAPADATAPDTLQPHQGVAPTRRVDTGDAAMVAHNRNAAGFQTDAAQRTVTVTQPCFATATPDRLDMLPPTPDEAARRDTVLLQELNAGTVFILRPGDKGQVEGEERLKLLVRFQTGALWVWRSDVAQ